MKVCVLVDSSSGLNKKDLQDMPDVFLIPLNIILPNGKSVADDVDHLSNEAFYNFLIKDHLKTSQINTYQIKQKWDELLTKYDKIIFVGLSKGISSQHQNILQLAKQEYAKQVIVLDTNGFSDILLEIIKLTLFYLHNNKPLEDLQKAVAEISKAMHTLFFVSDIQYLKKGGRISKPVALFCDKLKIVPILKFENGIIAKSGKTRTVKKAIQKSINDFWELTKPNHNNTLTVLYVNKKEEIFQLAWSMAEKSKFNKIKAVKAPNIILAHTGPNSVGFQINLKEHDYE